MISGAIPGILPTRQPASKNCDKMPREATKHKLETGYLLALIVLAAVVRLPGISASFYGDEGFSVLRDSNQLLTPTEDRFRPLFFSLLYLWRSLGFHGEFGLRGLSLLFGVLQVPVGVELARRLGGSRAGLVFGLLLALDPVLIEFSQELRMYSLVPLVALLQAWAFVEAAARIAEGRSALRAWVGFVLAGVVGVYTHFHYWFLMFGFAFALLRRRRELPIKQGLAALAAIVVLYLPNLPNLIRFQHEAGGAPHLLATDLPSALPKLVVAYSVGFNYFVLPELGMARAVRLSNMLPNLGLGLLVAIPTLVVTWQLWRLCRSRQPGPLFWLALELFAVPTAVSFCAVVATHKNFVHPKYMVFSAPFLLLLPCAGYLAVSARWARFTLTATSLCVFAVAIWHFNQPERFGRREDWRGAANYLRSALGERSVLLCLANAGDLAHPRVPGEPPRSLWQYYAFDLGDREKAIGLPQPDAKPEDLAPIIESLTADKDDVYYLWSEIERNFIDPGDAVLGGARQVLQGEQKRQFNPRLVVYHWRKH